MSMSTAHVPTLGPRTIHTPLRLASRDGFVGDGSFILRDIEVPRRRLPGEPRGFEKAGPREEIFFDPKKITVGIVSAGGICPGINDVIRSVVMELHHGYGVERILGV